MEELFSNKTRASCQKTHTDTHTHTHTKIVTVMYYNRTSEGSTKEIFHSSKKNEHTNVSTKTKIVGLL